MKTHLTGFIAVCVMVFALTASAATFYVDVNSANPVPPYADLTTAAVSIQDAVDAATNGDLILVNDGVYQDGCRTTLEWGGPEKVFETNRLAVNKPVTIQSLNGPSAAFIRGGGIYRCVYLMNGAALNGFTLMNGAAGNGGGVCGSTFLGGIVSNCVLTANTATSEGGGAYGATLANCQVTGNSAKIGGGAAVCTLINCNVTGNSTPTTGVNGPILPTPSTGGGIYAGSAINCVITGNIAWQGGGCSGGRLVNCTIVNNSAGFYGGISSSTYCSATNCVIYFNHAGTNDNFDPASSSNSALNDCCTFPMPASGVGNLTNNPTFVDYFGGDFHLQSNSPCINSGCNAAITYSFDLDGNPRIAGGTVDIGAYEFPTPASVLSYAWALQYGLPTDGSADFVDSDGDGMNNWQEFIAGTNPTNAASVLMMTSAVPLPSQNWVIVRWQSVNTRTYYLQRSTNLGPPAGFSTIQSNIVGMAGTTIFIDATATNGHSFFYRIGVQR